MPSTQTSHDTARQSSDAPALGARENWWGDDLDDEGDREQAGEQKYKDQGQGDDWGVHHDFVQGVDPVDQIAYSIRRDFMDAPHICGRTLSVAPWNGGRLAEQFAWLFEAGDADDYWPGYDGRGRQLHKENRAVELSPPDLYPCWMPPAQNYHGQRSNPVTGYLNWGESTWTMLKEVNKQQFLAGVREWLEREHRGLREWEQRQALNLASTRKSDPDLDDQEALHLVVKRVREQTDPDEENPFEKPEGS